MSQHPQMTPPGWYPNQAGQTQWWDGAAWGPVAPQQVVHPPAYVMRHPNEKSAGIAYLFLFLLGGVGAHRFYLGDAWHGVTYVILFMASFIFTSAATDPGFGIAIYAAIVIMWIVDLFCIPGRTRVVNARIMQQ